jgi:hypothetical protein
MQDIIYDIFAGARDKDPYWLESVGELSIAFNRLRELASVRPGPYFIFCAKTDAVIARVDTTLKLAKRA